MRTPTPRSELFRWHEAALRGEKALYHDEPQCGFYLTSAAGDDRVVWSGTKRLRRGKLLPASIWMDQPTDSETGELVSDERWRAEIAGTDRDPYETFMRCGKRPICRWYYMQLLSRLI